MPPSVPGLRRACSLLHGCSSTTQECERSTVVPEVSSRCCPLVPCHAVALFPASQLASLQSCGGGLSARYEIGSLYKIKRICHASAGAGLSFVSDNGTA